MPKFANGVHFSRPFTPFKCGGVYGATEGCGPGTYCGTVLTGARIVFTGVLRVMMKNEKWTVKKFRQI